MHDPSTGHLQTWRDEVESRLVPPDFAEVEARGRRLRRRRHAVAGMVAALAVTTALVGVTHALERDRALPPAQPAPTIDPDADGADRVLADPGAQVDAELSRVDGRGAFLAVVRVGASGGCGRTALRWTGPRGVERAWVDTPRAVVALERGFVVAAGPGRCGRGGEAYLVDEQGIPRDLAWGPGAARACANDPATAGCRFDLAARVGTFDAAVRVPVGAELLDAGTEGTWWARSADGRRLYWSADGRSWQHRDSGLDSDRMVSASASGRRGVLGDGRSVEFTTDGGRTWRTRDLAESLRAVRVTDVDWTVTRSGTLLGVTQLVGRGDVLFRSTDRGWTGFRETDVRTSFGLARPVALGRAVAVPDLERWALSVDDGATWRRTPGLG